MKLTNTPISDQVLSYQGQTLDNSMSLFHYQIVDSLGAASNYHSVKEQPQMNPLTKHKHNSSIDDKVPPS